jgi:hypothetical protein
LKRFGNRTGIDTVTVHGLLMSILEYILAFYENLFFNLSPFFGLNPYNTGLGRTSTELEPSDVTVMGHFIGIISHSPYFDGY